MMTKTVVGLCLVAALCLGFSSAATFDGVDVAALLKNDTAVQSYVNHRPQRPAAEVLPVHRAAEDHHRHHRRQDAEELPRRLGETPPEVRPRKEAPREHPRPGQGRAHRSARHHPQAQVRRHALRRAAPPAPPATPPAESTRPPHSR